VQFGDDCGTSKVAVGQDSTCFSFKFGVNGFVTFIDWIANTSETLAGNTNSSCYSRTAALNDVGPFFSQCYSQISFSENQNYIFDFHRATNPNGKVGMWWVATIQVGDSTPIVIGYIRHDYFTKWISSSSWLSDGISITDPVTRLPLNFADCNRVPIESALFGAPFFGNRAVASPPSGGATCGNYSILPPDAAGTVQFNFGGPTAYATVPTLPPTPTPTSTSKSAYTPNPILTPTPTPTVTVTVTNQGLKLVPLAMIAQTVKSELVGNKFNLSIAIPKSATNVYLASSLLGYSNTHPLRAVLVNGRANFVIPMTGKIYGLGANLKLYSSNTYGTSPVLHLSLKLPKIPTAEQSKPRTPTPNVATPTKTPPVLEPTKIDCWKGAQERVFVGTNCPPGWASK
jgi:hypothetical protein